MIIVSVDKVRLGWLRHDKTDAYRTLFKPHPIKIRITSTLRLRQAYCKQSNPGTNPFSFSRFEWLTYFSELPPINAVTEPAHCSKLDRNAQIDCRIFEIDSGFLCLLVVFRSIYAKSSFQSESLFHSHDRD